MSEPHVITALARKRGQLAGEIEATQGRLRDLIASLEALLPRFGRWRGRLTFHKSGLSTTACSVDARIRYDLAWANCRPGLAWTLANSHLQVL